MNPAPTETASQGCWRVLTVSTIAFTLLFSAWLMLGVLSIPIKKSLNLGDAQVDWLIAAAILAGSLPRLLFGIWADQFGGRVVYLGLLLFCAIPTYLLSRSTTYTEMLACALLFGLAGNSFSAGISWNSAWFPDRVKGLALGVVGVGNVGASGTKLLVLFVPTIFTLVPASGLLGGIIPGGWRFIPALYSVLLVLMALVVYLFAPVPDRTPGAGRPLAALLVPLKDARVWRFSLYYVVVFGSYVALSGWLPGFFTRTYKLEIHQAVLLTVLFIVPASLLRPVGGWLSDLYGPRVVTYAVFVTMIVALAALCVPDGVYFGREYRPGPWAFSGMMFVVGCGMGIGKASVYKYVPDYYPNDVGAVGGLVGALGALGGFVLPPLFGLLERSTGSPRMAFAALLVLTVVSLAWLHLAVMAIKARERRAARGSLAVEGSPS